MSLAKAKREGRVTAHDYVLRRYLPRWKRYSSRHCIWQSRRLSLARLPPRGSRKVEEVTRARQEGQDVTCRSCPHYFVLDTDRFEEIGFPAKCSPPIRDLQNQQGMWENCLTGEIDCTVSDHSPSASRK